jgi:hypothetical protein
MAIQVGPILSKPDWYTGPKGRKSNEEREGKFHQGQEEVLHSQAGYIYASYSVSLKGKISLQRWAGPYIYQRALEIWRPKTLKPNADEDELGDVPIETGESFQSPQEIFSLGSNLVSKCEYG